MKGQVYSIDVLLGTTLLLLALGVALIYTSPTVERNPSADTGQTYLLNAMKEAGILAEGIDNQTALQEVLNNTPASLCADLTLFEVKKKDGDGGENGDDDGDDDEHHHDEDEEEGGNGNGQDNNGQNQTSNLTEVFTLTKVGCDYALAENLSVSQFFSTQLTFKNNGKIDKFYLYRLRTWPKVS